jgi:hypothetical protein
MVKKTIKDATTRNLRGRGNTTLRPRETHQTIEDRKSNTNENEIENDVRAPMENEINASTHFGASFFK